MKVFTFLTQAAPAANPAATQQNQILALIIIGAVLLLMVVGAIIMIARGRKKKKASGKAKTTAAAKKTIQKDLLTFDGLTEDGILCTDKGFSVMYHLPEANFITETDEDQARLLDNYAKFLNALPDNVDMAIAIVGRHTPTEELAHTYHLARRGNTLDRYVEDYNAIIDSKLKEGTNDIAKDKYLVLTAVTHNLAEAKQLLNTTEIALTDKLKTIDRLEMTKLSALERLAVMKDITNGTEGRLPFEKEYAKYIDSEVDEYDKTTNKLSLRKMAKARASIKDIVAPPMLEKVSSSLRIGENRICRSFVIPDYPTQMDTGFVTSITDLPYETVTLLRFRTIPKQKAVRLVKMMNVNVKADVQKDTRKALREGLDPEVTLSEDLLLARDEARNLRNDVVVQGQKLFLSTVTTTMFAKNEEELTNIVTQYKNRCADFSISANPLYGLQLEAFRDAMLTGKNELMKQHNRLLTSENVRAVMPWNIQDIQDRKHGLFYGTNAVSGNAQMFNRRYIPLGNGLIFGQAGSGKSFFAKCEIAENYLASTDDEFVILDPENEFIPLAEAYGGKIVDLTPNGEYHINPFDMNMEWGEKEASPLTEKCDFAVSIVESILGKGRECNAYEVSAIHQAVENIYAPYIAEMNKRREDHPGEDIPDIDPAICPTLQDFYNALNELPMSEGKKIAQGIRPYCTGQYDLFAHHTNIDTSNRMIVFTLMRLPEKMKEMAMKVCLAHIWTRIVKNRLRNKKMGTKRRMWVYLDEFHLFMTTDSARTALIAYYKRVRKYGALMTGITQDVADIVGDLKAQTIFSNTGFFVFFNQSVLGQRALQNLYDLSDTLLDYVNDKGVGIGIMKSRDAMIPLNFVIPNDSLMYRLATTNVND